MGSGLDLHFRLQMMSWTWKETLDSRKNPGERSREEEGNLSGGLGLCEESKKRARELVDLGSGSTEAPSEWRQIPLREIGRFIVARKFAERGQWMILQC